LKTDTIGLTSTKKRSDWSSQIDRQIVQKSTTTSLGKI
jgi:hypothetical protein